MDIADRIQSVEASKSVVMAQKIIEMRAEGIEVVSFNVGEPDLPTPDFVIEATKEALDQRKTTYASVPGENYLRQAIAKRVLPSASQLSYQNVAVSNGSKQVLYSTFQILCNPNDEVIVPIPYWVSFPEAIRLAGARPVFTPPTSDNLIDVSAVKKAISDKTKAIIVNTPNNPTGRVEPKETMQELLQICRDHSITLISDEAYESVILTGAHTSPIEFDNNCEHSLIVQTFSKSFSMTGFRIGYVVGPETFVRNFIKLQSHICGNIPLFSQEGARAALTHEQAHKDYCIREYKKRCELAFKLCKDIFPDTNKPEGAFYLYPKVPQNLLTKHGNDVNLALHILEQARVALLPSSYFGQEGYLRICFATSIENIEKGFKAIKDLL